MYWLTVVTGIGSERIDVYTFKRGVERGLKAFAIRARPSACLGCEYQVSRAVAQDTQFGKACEGSCLIELIFKVFLATLASLDKVGTDVLPFKTGGVDGGEFDWFMNEFCFACRCDRFIQQRCSRLFTKQVQSKGSGIDLSLSPLIEKTTPGPLS